jgi:hypothetical protein
MESSIADSEGEAAPPPRKQTQLWCTESFLLSVPWAVQWEYSKNCKDLPL